MVAQAMPARADETPLGCAKEDFEQVVEQAAGSLRDLNTRTARCSRKSCAAERQAALERTTSSLQKAKPFVQDDKTVSYDQTTDELLSAIASMGQAGAAADRPDCARLVELRQRMKMLVDTQTAKWVYMFQKLDAELAN